MLHPRQIAILLVPASVLRVAVDGVDRMATASCVKRLLGPKIEVVVFEESGWVSFVLCGLPYYIGCVIGRLD